MNIFYTFSFSVFPCCHLLSSHHGKLVATMKNGRCSRRTFVSFFLIIILLRGLPASSWDYTLSAAHETGQIFVLAAQRWWNVAKAPSLFFSFFARFSSQAEQIFVSTAHRRLEHVLQINWAANRPTQREPCCCLENEVNLCHGQKTQRWHSDWLHFSHMLYKTIFCFNCCTPGIS